MLAYSETIWSEARRRGSHGCCGEGVGGSGWWGGGTVVLSALRSALREVGLVYETAPMQVVERLEQADLVADRPVAKHALALAAHIAYGTGAGRPSGRCAGDPTMRSRRSPWGRRWASCSGAWAGPAGCRSLAPTARRGATTIPKSCCRSLIMPCTGQRGVSCSGPCRARTLEADPPRPIP